MTFLNSYTPTSIHIEKLHVSYTFYNDLPLYPSFYPSVCLGGGNLSILYQYPNEVFFTSNHVFLIEHTNEIQQCV